MKLVAWIKKVFGICDHEWDEYTPFLHYSTNWKMLTCKKCGTKKQIDQ